MKLLVQQIGSVPNNLRFSISDVSYRDGIKLVLMDCQINCLGSYEANDRINRNIAHELMQQLLSCERQFKNGLMTFVVDPSLADTVICSDRERPFSPITASTPLVPPDRVPDVNVHSKTDSMGNIASDIGKNMTEQQKRVAADWNPSFGRNTKEPKLEDSERRWGTSECEEGKVIEVITLDSGLSDSNY
ncbi:hypothetical protein KQX54_003635 [Cotesia glomerata]|uniref:Uncharacterized protein n=1 Tax=Cotesia glomerata TaxID=32391 RepID=A0AAV7IBH4_COTGL|nr:hypothetical protein KQX54_003635 [Cotesia glomerata]